MRSPTGTAIYNYDPGQPISATNPSVNSIHLPTPPGHGLAICEVLGSGNSILTFYTIVDDKYWYYDPFTAIWVNTHHETASGGVAVNFGGGGGFIFNFDAIGGNVYKYDGTADGSLLLHIPGYAGMVGTGGVADVVVDCEGNWYIMLLFPGNDTNSFLRKYNAAGMLLQSWSISNPNDFTSGPGFGIVDDKIYLLNQIANPAGLSVPAASLSSSNINFTTIPPLFPIGNLNDDMGSVPSITGGTLPPATTISTPANPVCPQTAVTFTSIISNGGSNPSYQWFVNGVAMAGATSPTFSFMPDDGDIVSCLLARAAQVCSQKASVLSNAVTIHVIAPVAPALQYAPDVFCKDANPGIPLCSPAGGTFRASPEGLAMDMNTGIIDAGASNTGSYIVTYMPAATGCVQDSVSDTVTIVSLPAAQINTPDALNDLCLNEHFSLFVSPEAGCTYTWSPAGYFPDNDPASGAGITGKAVSDGIIYLTAVNEAGCIHTDTISVKTKRCCDMFVPNAFSPDNDGLNDVFRMYSKTDMQRDISFAIYNRWGEKVFAASDQSSGWDGTYHNRPADAGTYFYSLHYTCSDGTKRTLKGALMLIR